MPSTPGPRRPAPKWCSISETRIMAAAASPAAIRKAICGASAATIPGRSEFSARLFHQAAFQRRLGAGGQFAAAFGIDEAALLHLLPEAGNGRVCADQDVARQAQ